MKVLVLLPIVMLGLLIGCGKSDPAPATQPSQVASPATKPSAALLDIGGEPTEFAVTHLDVTRDQGSLQVQLYGYDTANPSVSSFYFDLTLDGDDPQQLSGQTWRMKLTEDVEIDGSVGIFLAGDKIRLEPKTVEVVFSGKYPNLAVSLNGTFLRDGDEEKVVKASGVFTVLAKEKAGN